MKRKTRAIAVTAITLAAAGGAVVGFLAGADKESPSEVMEPAFDISVSQQETKKPRYRLAAYQGRLAVFIIGKNQPEMVFDRYLHYLPDVDREKLEAGIEVAEYSELMRLIEDYTS